VAACAAHAVPAAFVGVSGVYSPDCPALLDHFATKGLDRPIVWAIMEAGLTGKNSEALLRASPCALLEGAVPGFDPAALAAALPPVLLCHGAADASAPASQSTRLAAALRGAGCAEVTERYYEGKTHTDPFLEDPILGGEDELVADVLRAVYGGHAAPPRQVFPRMLPRAVVALARRCTPF